MKTIKKLDGRRQKYKREKLINSILQAFEAAGELDTYAEEKANNIADFIEKEKEDQNVVDAHELGNLIEKGLMSCKKKNVAKTYILYRDERTRLRGNTTDQTVNEIVNGVSAY
jgi:ribonucleoside-triphosphate reductase (formate)